MKHENRANGSSTALILGASGTLGGAITQELGCRGYSLGLHYNLQKELCENLASAAALKGIHARCFSSDFCDPKAPAALVSGFLKEFSRIDVLVCAAGIVRDGPVIALKEQDFRAVVNVNLRALFLVFKALSRQFIRQKSGSIVVLSSHAGVAGRAGGSAYAMAHSGALALVKSAAREWGPLGVRVNAVLPPFVSDSGMGRMASPGFASKVEARCVLKSQSNDIETFARLVGNVLENPRISGQVLSNDSRIL